ncbi:Protein GrpE (HSP-70 cofactor) [Alteracholeplasma palmae J233]|uniref:Protein GrpE n=1 Tax=Alteracholeplasma palmae (strain ATCC 49389 / J233) TaxID=1318466 RepID=U4KKP8_ALTPJ|nr:nucleotide exchange factor GrpE [Alteracholeplasma palmae]CCV64208.1 Protein GrpE (HSP-70 cofactor) [Alteracholeplasma palmae J233]
MEKENDIIDENIQEDIVKEETPKKEKKKKEKEIIEGLNQEIVELKDKLLRNAAELENFKKRIQQERINDRKYAASNLINDLLVPLDQFAKVVEMKTDNEVLKNFLIGFNMINDQFKSILETEGVKEIDALNKPFDPTLHYAVEKVNISDKENGINVEVLQKGYTYKERILRPAMVKVNEWSENNNGEDK